MHVSVKQKNSLFSNSMIVRYIKFIHKATEYKFTGSCHGVSLWYLNKLYRFKQAA